MDCVYKNNIVTPEQAAGKKKVMENCQATAHQQKHSERSKIDAT